MEIAPDYVLRVRTRTYALSAGSLALQPWDAVESQQPTEAYSLNGNKPNLIPSTPT